MANIDVKNTVRDLCKNAEAALEHNLEKAYLLADEAYLKSLDIDDEEGISRSIYLFGMIKFRLREFSNANEYFENALNICQKHEHLVDIKLKILKALGDLRLEFNDYESALEYYLSCLDISSTDSYSNEKSGILYGLGTVYKELEQYSIAIEYFEEAVNLKENHKKYYGLCKLYSQISECYLYEGRLDEANNYIQKALNLAAEKNNNFDFGYAYMIYAKYLYEKSDYKESKVYFEKSMKKFSAEKYINFLLETMAEYGIMLFKSDSLREAEQTLSETSVLLLNQKNYRVELKVNLYLSKIYEKMNQFDKALNYFKRFYELKNVNDETWKKIKIKNIINRYEYLRTDIKVKELTNTNENLVTLSRLGREITSSLNHNEIIEKISSGIFERINCTSIGIGLVDHEKKILEYTLIEKNKCQKLKISTDNKNTYLVRLLYMTEESIRNDFYRLRKEKKISYNFTGIDENTQSMMACPLIFEKDTIGMILVLSESPEAFKENDLELLKILSSYTSIAISNSMKSQAIMDTNKKLKDMTERDGLTKVFNRYSLNTNVAKIVQKARKYPKPYSVIMIDVDYFKEYNDNYGHLAGDQCLIQVANLLNQVCAGEKSYIYRYGGDEFMILLLNRDEALMIAENICNGVSNLKIEHFYSKCSPYVSLTIGVATINNKYLDYMKAFALADEALYAAKSKGRNNVMQMVSSVEKIEEFKK